MSILKNPIFISLLVAGIVFIITYYYYNYYRDSNKDKEKKNKKNEKEGDDGKRTKKDNKKQNKKKGIEINEIMIISAVVAGLIAWYIASSYFTTDKSSNTPDENNVITMNNDSEVISDTVTGGNRSMKGGSIKDRQKNKISHLESDDSTRSYNMIGSGVNIPRADLKIPSVLIDYK